LTKLSLSNSHFSEPKKHVRPVWKPNRKSARKTMNSKLTDNHKLTGAVFGFAFQLKNQSSESQGLRILLKKHPLQVGCLIEN